MSRGVFWYHYVKVTRGGRGYRNTSERLDPGRDVVGGGTRAIVQAMGGLRQALEPALLYVVCSCPTSGGPVQ